MMNREYTNKLLAMVDDGMLDKDMVIMAFAKYMSESNIKDMMEANEMLEDEEEEEDDNGEDIDNFNWVGSRHHY